jgi:hypothetical protein
MFELELADENWSYFYKDGSVNAKAELFIEWLQGFFVFANCRQNLMQDIGRDLQKVFIFRLEYVKKELIDSLKGINLLFKIGFDFIVSIIKYFLRIESFQNRSTDPTLTVLDLIF